MVFQYASTTTPPSTPLHTLFLNSSTISHLHTFSNLTIHITIAVRKSTVLLTLKVSLQLSMIVLCCLQIYFLFSGLWFLVSCICLKHSMTLSLTSSLILSLTDNFRMSLNTSLTHILIPSLAASMRSTLTLKLTLCLITCLIR